MAPDALPRSLLYAKNPPIDPTTCVSTGSTIGPIISSNTGIRAVDVGMAQLSMHSVREMMGVQDLPKAITFFAGFLQHFKTVDNQIGA